MVVIKSDSFLEKKVIIFAGNFPVFLSSSSFNLLAEIKAISTPEKKAENNKVEIAIDTSMCVKILKLNLFELRNQMFR